MTLNLSAILFDPDLKCFEDTIVIVNLPPSVELTHKITIVVSRISQLKDYDIDILSTKPYKLKITKLN